MVMKSIPPKSGGELGWDLHWKPLGGLFFGSGIWRACFCMIFGGLFPSKFKR